MEPVYQQPDKGIQMTYLPQKPRHRTLPGQDSNQQRENIRFPAPAMTDRPPMLEVSSLQHPPAIRAVHSVQSPGGGGGVHVPRQMIQPPALSRLPNGHQPPSGRFPGGQLLASARPVAGVAGSGLRNAVSTPQLPSGLTQSVTPRIAETGVQGSALKGDVFPKQSPATGAFPSAPRQTPANSSSNAPKGPMNHQVSNTPIWPPRERIMNSQIQAGARAATLQAPGNPIQWSRAPYALQPSETRSVDNVSRQSTPLAPPIPLTPPMASAEGKIMDVPVQSHLPGNATPTTLGQNTGSRYIRPQHPGASMASLSDWNRNNAPKPRSGPVSPTPLQPPLGLSGQPIVAHASPRPQLRTGPASSSLLRLPAHQAPGMAQAVSMVANTRPGNANPTFQHGHSPNSQQSLPSHIPRKGLQSQLPIQNPRNATATIEGFGPVPSVQTANVPQQTPGAQVMHDPAITKQLNSMKQQMQMHRQNSVRERAAIKEKQSRALNSMQEQYKALKNTQPSTAPNGDSTNHLQAMQAKIQALQAQNARDQATMKKTQAEQMKRMMKQQLDDARKAGLLEGGPSSKINVAGGKTSGAKPRQLDKQMTRSRKQWHELVSSDSDSDAPPKGHGKKKKKQTKKEASKEGRKHDHSSDSSSEEKEDKKENDKEQKEDGEKRKLAEEKKEDGDQQEHKPNASPTTSSNSPEQATAPEPSQETNPGSNPKSIEKKPNSSSEAEMSVSDDENEDISSLGDDVEYSELKAQYAMLRQQYLHLEHQYVGFQEDSVETRRMENGTQWQQDNAEQSDHYEMQPWNAQIPVDPGHHETDGLDFHGVPRGTLEHNDNSQHGIHQHEPQPSNAYGTQYSTQQEQEPSPKPKHNTTAYLAGGVALGAAAGGSRLANNQSN